MMPMPHIAIAAPCFSFGKASSSSDCEIGTSDAPNTPCRMRNSTISPMPVAIPHSSEATVKPLTAMISRRRRPSRPASQPVTGVRIAAATM